MIMRVRYQPVIYEGEAIFSHQFILGRVISCFCVLAHSVANKNAVSGGI